jgi:GrpB-like predicted nucleotidyltransferase (UPF0157 family)
MSATHRPTCAVGSPFALDAMVGAPAVYCLSMVGLRRGSVLLVPHRSEWRKLFEEEAARLRSALGEKILRVEHVGSTAVESMEAKPLIDMMAAVESLEDARGLVPALERMGYEHRGDGGVRGRIFLAKGPRSRRTHHLSLAEPTSDHWQKSLLFRDHLWAHPEVAEEYRNLKRELARKFPEDRDSYTAGKDSFIERSTECALTGDQTSPERQRSADPGLRAGS